jgi:hypothetical protein
VLDEKCWHGGPPSQPSGGALRFGCWGFLDLRRRNEPFTHELLHHLADGLDTRTVARLMSISELTVQDHLKAVFRKTATSSRRELLAMSLGR